MTGPEFKEFDAASQEEWFEKILANLKVDNLDDVNTSLDKDLSINPFNHRDQAQFRSAIQFEKSTNSWTLGEQIDLTDDVLMTNKRILHALNMGVNGLVINFAHDDVDLESLFQDINFEFIELYLQFADSQLFWESDFWKKKRSQLNGFIQFDNAISDPKKLSILSSSSLRCKAIAIKEGESSVQQLTLLLSKIYKIIKDHSNPNQIFLEMPLRTSYLLEIGKLRAVRILWANLLKSLQMDDVPLKIIAYPDLKGLNSDLNYRMIQTTSILMSGIIGGADFLYTSFETESKNVSVPFYKRITRNIQHIAVMESFLDQVKDPAAGSYYIENITNSLVEKSWAEFKNFLS